ncbi:MAG TPA: UbiA family prenyltransferase [Yinghuangia sp.]|uniref:UbiA family prenyltransferase n=1 Tax=Yinghuangia sp. YIM S10712 TaxID=3436930 RepID=UPI002C5CD2A8|nr:UbiA family prenyltransferase [Yinghuangia sp.]
METLRPYDLVVVSLIGATGTALGGPGPDAVAQATAAVAAAAACASALYAADYLTRSQDMATKPDRPIPSGRLSPCAATTSAGLAAVVAVVLMSLLNVRALLFVVLAAVASYAYGRWLKDRGLWGDAATGFAGWSCPLLAGACLAAPWPPAELVAPAVALGVQGAFGNLLLALDDRPNDLKAHCRTHPVRHGPTRTARTLGVLSAATYTTAAFTPVLTGRPPTAGFLLFLGAAVPLAVAVLAATRPHAGGRLHQAVTRHLYERLLLPGALLALAGQTTAATAATAAAALTIALTPRPMLHAAPARSGLRLPGGTTL